MGGTWGLSVGTVDSSNSDTCGEKKAIWWGHENCKSAVDEGNCNQYQHSNNHNPNAATKKSDNIVNLMYAGSPDYNYGREPSNFKWPSGPINGTRMSGCAVAGRYKTDSANAFALGTFEVLGTHASGGSNAGSNVDYELTFLNPSGTLANYDATKTQGNYDDAELYDLYLTLPDTWPNVDSGASFTFSHPAGLFSNKAADALITKNAVKNHWGNDKLRQRSEDIDFSTGTNTLVLRDVQPFVDRNKANGMGAFKLLVQDVDHPKMSGDTGTFRLVVTKAGDNSELFEVFNGPMHVWLGTKSIAT
jgi:hypothetical protein